MGLDSIISDPEVDSAVKSLQLVCGFDMTTDELVKWGKNSLKKLKMVMLIIIIHLILMNI